MEFKEFGERGGESGNKQLLKSPGNFKKIKLYFRGNKR